MLLTDLSNSGAMPVLGRVMQFAGQRQRLLAHNIANLETPNFTPLDVSTTDFQAALAKAVDERRERGGVGGIALPNTDEVQEDAWGNLRLTPHTPSANIAFHDRNNRDLERMMQDLAENALVHRTAGDLLRRENDLLRVAISQRV